MIPDGYQVGAMGLPDVPEVAALESRIFPTPWSAAAFRHELTANPYSRSWVVRDAPGGLAGYVCIWCVDRELLINNIAVAPEHRRRGIARALLARALQEGRDGGCRDALLEVRPTNKPALGLYHAFGFRRVGLRRGYYGDGEDALVLGVAL